MTQHDLLKLKILKSEIIKMNRGHKECCELKAETNLEFVVSLQEQPVLELKGKHRYRNPERICDFCFKYKYETFFKLHFAIKGKDGIYPFQIELYQNHDTEYYDDIYFFLDVCPIGGNFAFVLLVALAKIFDLYFFRIGSGRFYWVLEQYFVNIHNILIIILFILDDFNYHLANSVFIVLQ